MNQTETREKVRLLIDKAPITIDTINQINTILMLEKTTLLNEKMVFDNWEKSD